MGVIADKLRDLQKAYKENDYAEYDQILDFAIEIAEEEENKHCEWENVIPPHGMPVFYTSCGKISLSRVSNYDIYCNFCGKKIKIVGDTKSGDSD
jgi:hypothetical protein|nr:MAG TPA: restriction alleviation protein [Bacteriophage sp.]